LTYLGLFIKVVLCTAS